MISDIKKVTHYEVVLNLTQMEFEVFKAVMSNLKESEVLEASGYNSTSDEARKLVLEAYSNLKNIKQQNIELGK